MLRTWRFDSCSSASIRRQRSPWLGCGVSGLLFSFAVCTSAARASTLFFWVSLSRVVSSSLSWMPLTSSSIFFLCTSTSWMVSFNLFFSTSMSRTRSFHFFFSISTSCALSFTFFFAVSMSRALSISFFLSILISWVLSFNFLRSLFISPKLWFSLSVWKSSIRDSSFFLRLSTSRVFSVASFFCVSISFALSIKVSAAADSKSSKLSTRAWMSRTSERTFSWPSVRSLILLSWSVMSSILFSYPSRMRRNCCSKSSCLDGLWRLFTSSFRSINENRFSLIVALQLSISASIFGGIGVLFSIKASINVCATLSWPLPFCLIFISIKAISEVTLLNSRS